MHSKNNIHLPIKDKQKHLKKVKILKIIKIWWNPKNWPNKKV